MATNDEIRKVYDDAYDNSTDPGFVSTLRAVYNLGRQHGAAQPPGAQPTPPTPPAGGLVERLRSAVRLSGGFLTDDEWQVVVHEVAEWLVFEGFNIASNKVLLEAGK